MNHRGIADVEFKLDERDGKYKMLDINSRFWYQTVQATAAGINFPLVQYLDLTGQEVPELPEQRDGVCWLNGPSDLLSVMSRRNEVNPLTEVLGPWARARCYSYYAWDDPRPAISRTFSRATFANLIFQMRGRDG
jgi:predicted ATP-grasp superfamily ATP-dependent carboligase